MPGARIQIGAERADNRAMHLSVDDQVPVWAGGHGDGAVGLLGILGSLAALWIALLVKRVRVELGLRQAERFARARGSHRETADEVRRRAGGGAG